MAQTKEGIVKAVKTIRERHGDQFWTEIGAIGGRAKVSTKGFGADRERASRSGKLGGARSSRRGVPNSPKTKVAS